MRLQPMSNGCIADLYLNQEMAQKYVQLMEDLQYSRRQAQAWKQKHLITEQQLQTSHQQNQQLKKTINRLQETGARLAEVNRQLSAQKESIITDYSEQVGSIKQQIAKKQREILELKESASPTLMNHQLAIRQLRFQLQDEFHKNSAGRQKKLQEVSDQLERQRYERQMQREKAALKLASLQAEIRQLKQRHEQQITSYSSKLLQAGQLKPPQHTELLRRTKRDHDQFKKRLDLATSDLSTVLEEKNQLHRDHSKWMKEHQKVIADHQNEISAYKAEVARVTALLEESSSKRDEALLKDRERDIKKLKGEAELLRDHILSKQQKISELEVENAKLQADIKSIRSQQQSQLSKVQQASQWERDRLKKEIIQARHTLERIKGQNLQLNDRIYEASRTTSEERKKLSQLQRQQEEHRNMLKRQASEQQVRQAPLQAVSQQKKAALGPWSPPGIAANENQQQIKQLEQAFRTEKGKLRDFLTKYVELKRKYESCERKYEGCERKLKKANQKIMELLQNKLILGSPKANPQKHFDFPTQPRTDLPTQPRTDLRISPPPATQPSQLAESRNQVLSSMNVPVATANFKSVSKIIPTALPGKRSPAAQGLQGKLHIRIEDEQEGGDEQSYYQKSMKLKTQQFKELKCTNHTHS